MKFTIILAAMGAVAHASKCAPPAPVPTYSVDVPGSTPPAETPTTYSVDPPATPTEPPTQSEPPAQSEPPTESEDPPYESEEPPYESEEPPYESEEPPYESEEPPKETIPPSGALSISVEQLDKAIPEGKAGTACSGDSSEGCVDNEAAAKAITNALTKYDITRRGELVAGVALMAFESGKWQYNINLFPGRPGQGTRAMLMYDFVYKYAKDLYPDQVQDDWATTTDNSTMNKVRDLVLNDNDSFGSAYWYLTAQASEYHNNDGKLRDGNVDDFKDYCINGVGAGEDEERWSLWKQINAAL